MKRTVYHVRYIHAKTGFNYFGVFHSEKEMKDFIDDFIVLKNHVLVNTWVESY